MDTGNVSAAVATWLLVSVLVTVGVVDVWLATTQNGETVSSYIHRLSARYPILPLLAGVVLGHLFWPQ